MEWISVKVMNPKKITNKVLVYCKNGYIGFGHYEKFNGNEIWYNLESQKPFTDWDLEDCETYEVTHWMPPPAPPIEEAKEIAFAKQTSIPRDQWQDAAEVME